MIRAAYRSRRFHRSLSAAICATLLLGSAVPGAEAQARIAHFQLDIPAQDLDTALQSLALASHHRLLYRSELVSGKSSIALKGEYTAEQAIQALLSGTNLTYEITDGSVVLIRAREMPASLLDISSSTLQRSTADDQTVAAAWDSSGSRTRLAQADGAAASASGARDEKDAYVELDTIVVVGSRLAEHNEQIVPVKVIGRKEIERSGATSIAQVLNHLSAVSVQSTTSPNQNSRGSSDVQLRGLPDGTTLVLLNGRRMTGTPFQATGGGVNLNVLPLGAVERIEVLPTGSSALYGGDALAGVVNIVMNRDFSGVEASVSYGFADGYDEKEASIALGWSSDRASLSFVASARENSELTGLERGITANNDYRRFGGHDASQPYSRAGNIYSLDGMNLPGLNSPFAGIPLGTDGTGLAPADFADGALNLNPSFWALAAQIPVTKQHSGLLYGTFQLTEQTELFAELLYSRYEAEERDYPYMLDGQFGSYIVPATNPFNPFGVDVGIDKLFEGAGRWCFCIEQEYYRPLVGARGSIGSWRWEMAATVTRAEDRTDEGPFFDGDLVNAALADTNPQTALNPFADRSWSYAELAPYIYSSVTKMSSELQSIDGFMRGSLFELGAGDVQALVGAQYDRSSLDYDYFITQFSADRTAYAFFSEVRVPLIGPQAAGEADRLAVSGAVRYDHYSDFGSRTSPQIAVEMRPVSSLLVRAAYSSAYKPPTLYQISAPMTQYVNFPLADPRRGGESYTFTLRQGGNPRLDPMTGESTLAGFVFTPDTASDLQLSATHWTVKLEDYTSIIGFETMVDNEALFSNEIHRAAPTPQDTANGQPGRIVAIDNVTVNYGTIDMAGVDIDVSARLRTGMGDFVPALSVTNTYKYDAALIPGSPVENRVSHADSNGYAPRWKGSASLTWDTSLVEAALVGRYVGRYQDYAPSTRELGDFWLFDANVRYELGRSVAPGTRFDGVSLALGIVNIFDELPEYSYLMGTVGYDMRQYDIRGRFGYIQLNTKF